MRYVDAHCHLDQYPEPSAEVGACVATQTYTLAVTNVPWDFERTLKIVRDGTFVRVAAGLHPELVARFPSAIDELLPLLAQTKYVGEVGLDYSRATRETRALQRRVFARIVEECERLGGRVLSVHSRRAAGDVVESLAGLNKSTIILHWYSGTTKILHQAVAAGCYFSVNPAMARSASGRAIIRTIPHDRILTESDGPSVKLHDRPMRPFQMADAIGEIAAIRGESRETFAARVLRNFRTALTPSR